MIVFMMTKLFREYLLGSWWVVGFILFCAIVYENGLRTREEDALRLASHLEQLHYQKESALATQIDLQTKINSQNDPAWIELILMKNLGLVPEGYQKVFFIDPATASMQ